MTTLLVLTAGQTDVQLVVDGVRRELRKDRCAALHDEIERRASRWRIVDAPDRKTEPPVEALPERELLLCTPKLDAVLRAVVPASVLLLETRRDARAAPGDPRFAGAVLEARLKARGAKTVHRRAYLQGTERLEDRDEARDAVICREVVHRLEQAVRDTIEAVRPSRIVVAATGGFPVVTSNLLGAWAIAEPLHGDERERAWTKVIEWLACFASSLPIPEGCDIPVLMHKRMAVRAALRVELALRAGDIPRAVHGTVAFFEAALWDHLGEKTSRHPSKRQFKFHVPPAEDLVRERDPAKLAVLSKTKQREDGDRPFIFKETADGSDWYWIDDNEICAIQIAKHYLKLDSLTKLGQALAGDIRELRNDVAHNEPTPALMEDARRRMQGAALWSSSNGFMSQPLVQAVLRELGEQQPEVLCTELIAEVRSRLLEAPRVARSGG